MSTTGSPTRPTTAHLPAGWRRIIDAASGRFLYQSTVANSTHLLPPAEVWLDLQDRAKTLLMYGWERAVLRDSEQIYFLDHINQICIQRTSPSKASYSPRLSVSAMDDPRTRTVRLFRKNKSFGFIPGDGPPLQVHSVDEDGPAAGLLEPRDELVALNDIDCQSQSASDLLNLMKRMDCVSVTLRRRLSSTPKPVLRLAGTEALLEESSDNNLFILKVYLPSGGYKSLSCDSNDTVASVVERMAQKMNIADVRRYGLCLKSSQGKETWFEPGCTVKEFDLADSGDTCYLYIRFFPATAYDLANLEPVTLEHLYHQVVKSVVNSQYWDLGANLAIELGCLHLCHWLRTYNLKLNFNYIEKEVGLKHFFPAHVLLTAKPKELRKQVVTSQKELKQVGSLHELMVKYLTLASGCTAFGATIVAARVNDTATKLTIGPKGLEVRGSRPDASRLIRYSTVVALSAHRPPMSEQYVLLLKLESRQTMSVAAPVGVLRHLAVCITQYRSLAGFSTLSFPHALQCTAGEVCAVEHHANDDAMLLYWGVHTVPGQGWNYPGNSDSLHQFDTRAFHGMMGDSSHVASTSEEQPDIQMVGSNDNFDDEEDGGSDHTAREAGQTLSRDNSFRFSRDGSLSRQHSDGRTSLDYLAQQLPPPLEYDTPVAAMTDSEVINWDSVIPPPPAEFSDTPPADLASLAICPPPPADADDVSLRAKKSHVDRLRSGSMQTFRFSSETSLDDDELSGLEAQLQNLAQSGSETLRPDATQRVAHLRAAWKGSQALLVQIRHFVIFVIQHRRDAFTADDLYLATERALLAVVEAMRRAESKETKQYSALFTGAQVVLLGVRRTVSAGEDAFGLQMDSPSVGMFIEAASDLCTAVAALFAELRVPL
eukprot:m.146722 g.146722  ORF g.146722 m.146722 type:complete len:882 (-) comp16814_c0_seq3:496-3141(-)